MIVPFFTRPFNIEVLRGVESALMQAGKELVLYNVETSSQRDHYFSELPMLRKVDGLLIISLLPAYSSVQAFQTLGLPAVLVDTYDSRLTSLVVDNIEGAYQAVKYLIDQGHRRIGFINGAVEGSFKFNQANDRLIGLHRAFGEAGLQFDPELLLTSEWDRGKGREAALKLLSRPDRPTAIFTACDVQAIGALEAAKALHIAVPGELSVIGYDGIELSELMELTTVQQPMQSMGELGVKKLLEHIEVPSRAAELIRLSTVLVERCTTAPLASIT